MRFVIYGAGAIGGTIGARLFQAGHDVTLIARGEHLDALQTKGLTLRSPEEDVTLPIPAVGSPGEAGLSPGDVVLLAMKTQHTADAVATLARAAPPGVAVACAQNGIENERIALRSFPDVYGICVMLPAGHLEPGVVEPASTPITGLLDMGRYPAGVDARAEEVSAAFAGATFSSGPRPDIMRWKYRKLLLNLGNAVEAVTGTAGWGSPAAKRLTDEGEAVLRAAGIDYASAQEDRERRGDLLRPRPVGGGGRPRGSSWQSLVRGVGSIEVDYLNGEIALLGRLHGVPTPANDMLQLLANRFAAERRPPGAITADELDARLAAV
jgi:2-dehydropantoate 2-reductase